MFTVGQTDNEPEQSEERTERRTIGSVRADAREKANKQWFWYSVIDKLAMGDIIKYEAVTELPLTMCLNKMAYEIDNETSYMNMVMGRGLY